jgi:uncharacterized coiled-coil protein SlyX
MSENRSLEDRLIELETTVSFQNETIRQLDVHGSASALEGLRQELEDLREQTRLLQEEEAPMEEQVPPHYGGGDYT